MTKKLIWILLFVVHFAFGQCGTSFGNPVFLEDFGTQQGNSNYAGPLTGEATTTYTYVATNAVSDGSYTITTSPHFALGAFHTTEDNTEDANGTVGNMLVVNADFNAGEFYRRRVSNLCSSGSVYQFSAFLMNVLLPDRCLASERPVNVRFEVYTIDGVLLGATDSGDIFKQEQPIWQEFNFEFTLPEGITELDVVLANNGDGGCGNDLAIDDISFRICGSDLELNSSIDLFNQEICSPQEVTLTANLVDNNIDIPVYEWFISSDNGATWNELPCNAIDCLLSSEDYNNGDLIRFAVQSANNSNELCKLYSNASVVNLMDFSFNNLNDLLRYSENNTSIFNLNSVENEIGQNGFNLSDLTIQYFENLSNAESNNSAIINPNTFQSESTTVYVKIDLNDNDCATILPLNLIVEEPLVFSICDEDDDGVHTINYQELLHFIESETSNVLEQGPPVIYISRANNGIVEIRDPLGTPEYNVLCSSLPAVNGYYELATNNNGELYLVTDDRRLLIVDLENCDYEVVNSFFPGGNIAMSFDTQNNLYSGSLLVSHVNVSRELDGYTSVEDWFDFGEGRPAGDFIELNGKLYISWDINGGNVLYEVTIDENYNYVSHINLGSILNNSFGLAGEFGVLYGVTTSQVYRIDLEPFGIEVLFNNPSTSSGNRWFGAAGKHEAQISLGLYHTLSDAENQNNPITGDFVNQVVFEDLVYYRIDDGSGGAPVIIPIIIEVNPVPPVPQFMAEYISCREPVLLESNIQGNFTFQWFFNGEPIGNSSANLLAEQSGEYSLIVTDSETGCSNTETFTTVTIIDVQIEDVAINGNEVRISASGAENLEYSIGGEVWQNSNTFILENGDHQIYVRSGDCIAGPYPITLFFISNLITPNNDGKNDTWRISNIKNYPDAVINIYDRYGKLIFSTTAADYKEWDGTYLGSGLPAGSYWYTLKINELNYRGPIAIKR